MHGQSRFAGSAFFVSDDNDGTRHRTSEMKAFGITDLPSFSELFSTHPPLSPELLEEGFVREIISKIQTMRKEADFEVMDRIKVTYEGSEKAEAVFEKNNTLIAGEVLADEVVKAQPDGYVKEWKINGEAVTMGVEKKGE